MPDIFEYLINNLLSGKAKPDEPDPTKGLSPSEQVDYVMSTAVDAASYGIMMSRAKALSNVLRRKLPFTPEQILQLARLSATGSYYFPFAHVLRLASSLPMTPELRQALEKMRSNRMLEPGQGLSVVARRLDEMLNARDESAPFQPAGKWTARIAAEIDPAWRAVLEAGTELSGSEASGKWRHAAEDRMKAIGREAFRTTALRWLEIGPSPDTPGTQAPIKESDYQRGLLWSLTGFNDAEMCASLARFAEQCLKKIPMIGAVSQKSGNACIRVLAAMNGMEPVSQLARLAMRVKYQTAQRLVQEALEEAAQRQGIRRDQLAEITVPDFGLGADGIRNEQLGGTSVQLDDAGCIAYFSSDGKPLKSAPEALKRDFADDLKELKQTAKEIAVMRAAHTTRIERLLLSQREIPVSAWRTSYLDHPLLASVARNLIWQSSSGATAIWHEGRLLEWSGAEVSPGETVRLWHPVNADAQTVLSWRCWLEDRHIRQPFKQAHREVYLLTDAERATQTYSHRFAGHILKQHQFAALCEQRGWQFRLMGQWDSHNNAEFDLPQFELRAEFTADFPRDEAVSGHAIYLYLATDRLRFMDRLTSLPRELNSIPQAVFSEVMRDADLFVGVASIGNDPLWGQQDPAPFGHYWGTFSFGELSAAAEQRRDVIVRMLPQLAIRDRCSLEGHFLIVRGDRATYKIHLGSSNVLIEPGSRYLCIVRGPATAKVPDKLFLPFESDGMLSLILSKAFMLAADAKITDPSITRQLP